MYASIHRLTDILGTSADVLRTANQLGLALSRRSGFVSYALLEEEGQVGVSILIFETQADLTLANQFAEDWVAEQRVGWQANPYQVTTGEVIVQYGL